MSIEEQAAMYKDGVKKSSVENAELSRVLADATLVHDWLEELLSAREGESLKSVFGGLPVPDTRYSYVPPPLSESMGYAASDAAWSVEFFNRMVWASRLAAQRPLIHNGRKMKR